MAKKSTKRSKKPDEKTLQTPVKGVQMDPVDQETREDISNTGPSVRFTSSTVLTDGGLDETSRPNTHMAIPDSVTPRDEASPEADGSRPQPPDREHTSGLTSLADYYQEPTPEPERVLTAAQLESIREEAFTERFGAPVPDFRSAVVARLNDKLRS